MINHINKRKDRDSPSVPVVKNLPANAGDTGSIPGPGRFHKPGGGKPRGPQLLKPVHPEPTGHNERGPHSEEPVPRSRDQPLLTTGRENPHATMKVQHSPNTRNKKFIKGKDKNHMVISTDAEKAFDKSQHAFMIKALIKVGIKGTYLNIIKTLYNKPTGNIILNGKKMKSFLLKSETGEGYPLSLFLFYTVLDILVTEIR